MNRKLAITLCCLLILGLSKSHAQAPVTDFSATPTSGCGPLGVTFKDVSTNNPNFWSWDFGNGQTSSQQNPAVTYATAGTYTVTLITRNASGTDAMRKTGYITVFPFPQASGISNLAEACAPANVQFTDKSTPGQGSIVSWNWTFGDGGTSTQQNPTHSYAQPGYYNVALTVQNSSGCSNAIGYGRFIRVVNGIQPNFVYDQSSVSCSAPFVGTLLNQTAGPGTLSYNWTIGDGATPAGSTATNPVVNFPTNSTYNVSLQVVSSFGCTASIQQPLTFSNTNAIINGPTTVCVNSPTTFSNGSTPVPSTVIWTFGDGTTSNAPSPSKTFTATGPTTIKLVNKYAGCADSIIDPLTVVSVPIPAFAATPVSSCKAPLTVTFTDQTTPAATSWLWNFGDGQTSNAQNPTHTYTTAGNFNVSLTVTGAGSCPGTTTRNALVTIQAPTVSIGGTLSACVKPTGDNSNITPAANFNAPDGVASYAWTATGSNESSSTSATPTFTYAAAGSYPVSVIITTNGGCTATATATAQIGTSTPTSFTVSSNPVCGNSTETFSTASTPADSYNWNFGDGTATGAITLPSASHSYKAPGPYNTSLTITHAGCPTTAVVPITVSPAIPNFGYAGNCAVSSLSVTFSDSSLTDAGLVSYSWNYGDGTSAGPITAAPYLPPHTFPGPGSYPVTLTIIDGACTTTITKNVVVGAVNPLFTLSPGAPYCHNTPQILTSTSTVTPPLTSAYIAGYTWTVNGVATIGGSSFSTTPVVNGPCPITLTVTDINGCTYTSSTTTIQVVGPTSLFADPAIGGGCKNKPTTFTDESTSDPTTGSPLVVWYWDFGDGTQVNETAPFSHVYTDTGGYNVILRVTDGQGCKDSYSYPVNITAPTANFAAPDSFYCPGVPLTFIDSSQGYNLTDNWTFGNGNAGTTPITTYPTSGIYSVSLTVTDKFNCSNSITKPVNIEQPVAAFNIYDTTAICTPLETIFAAHTQYADSLYWDFGDGTTSTLDSTSHFYNTFNTTGPFTATLYAQGPGGCLASATRKVYVENPYTSTFTYSPLRHCDSVQAQFNITPVPYANFQVQFGDATADSSGNTAPIHIYRTLGTYGPALQLTDETGCIVDIPQPEGYITVLGATPYFSVDKPAFCDSSIVNFTDYTISNDGLASETYNFGDGSPNDAITGGTGTFNVSHFYDQVGTWLAKLTVVTTDNCTESYTDTIRVYQTPDPAISTTGLLCTGLIQFNGSLTAPQIDTITWAWNFGNGQSSTLQNPMDSMRAGTYTVALHASTSFGCQGETSALITIFAPPSIKGPPEITTPIGIPVTLPMTYSANIVSFAWTPASDLDCPTCANPAATLLYSAEYYVTVTDDNSCTATDSIFIKTICNSQNYFLPNTFSPNGDGVNDYFYPRGTSLYNVQSLTVFNRWGQMVFQRRDFPANASNMGWDGTFGGKPAPADAYVYIVEVVCDNSQVVAIHGSVTLVR